MTDDNEASDDPDAVLTPSEVGKLFRVNPKTVTRWARAGKLHPIAPLAATAGLQSPRSSDAFGNKPTTRHRSSDDCLALWELAVKTETRLDTASAPPQPSP